MCPNCRAFITTDDKSCPYCEASIGARIVDRRMPADVLGGLIPHARFTTVMIMLLNFGLYIAMMARSSQMSLGGAMDMNFDTLFDFGAKHRVPILRGEWWRFITAGFLHGGLFHIGMNSWALFDLGTQVEETFGTSRYLVLYVVTTITGFLASYYWTPALSVGASAAIFGLIGAMIMHGILDRSARGEQVKGVYTRWAIYSLLFGFLSGFSIDNAAHLGGLAGGFAVAYVAGTPGRSNVVERFWHIAAVACVGLTVYGFAQVFLKMFGTRII
jgi:rhomboid protease GluP